MASAGLAALSGARNAGLGSRSIELADGGNREHSLIRHDETVLCPWRNDPETEHCYHHRAGQARRTQMAAIPRTVFRRVPTETEFEAFKSVVMFCAAGLFVSLLVATYGVDLSPGFF
jgi:hypothetical protein